MPLTLIKAAHTLAWFSIESCMAYVLDAGAARRTGRGAALAGAVVAGERLIFAANEFRCPLTQLAEKIGAADGSVTDIWLPRWFAHNLPAIHVPRLAVAAYLNGRNLRDRQRHTQPTHDRNLGLADRAFAHEQGGLVCAYRPVAIGRSLTALKRQTKRGRDSVCAVTYVTELQVCPLSHAAWSNMHSTLRRSMSNSRAMAR